jgi:hypothetical protein
MVLVRGGKLSATDTAPSIFYALGSNCTGTTGTTGRTLTLSGVATSEMVYVQGAYLFPADYSKATVASKSVLTFQNKVYDQFQIYVYYWR